MLLEKNQSYNPISDILKVSPVNLVDGIMVFSSSDAYTENYEKIASDHVEAINQGVENPFMDIELWKEMEQSTRELILQYVKPGMRILDVGVGTGRLLKGIENIEKSGIDISIPYLKIARDNGYNVFFSRIENMPFNDGAFDMVVMTDVLEHVLDLNACTEQILRVLKPGGKLVVRVPNMENMAPYLDENLPYEYIHLRTFDLNNIRLHFEKIFLCKYIEHSYSGFYIDKGTLGMSRLKIRLIGQSSPLRKLVESLSPDNYPLFLLKEVSTFSEEDFIEWICHIKEDYPSVFKQVANDLINPLEINVVFEKMQKTD